MRSLKLGQSLRANVKRVPAVPRTSARELLRLIGHTPLVALPRLDVAFPGVRLLAPAVCYTPGGSVTPRPPASIIEEAETSGRIREGLRLLDATSGNTGIAYAMIAAVKRYPVTLCVPKSANPQVLALLRAYGAELVLTDPLQGSDGAIREARRLSREFPGQFLYLDQYNTPANWQAHYRTTAEELWEQTRGTITHFVAGLGTTGTFTGTSRRLKELNPGLRAIAVQPSEPLHGLEGLKHLEAAIVPGIYDAGLQDETLFISTEAAYEAVRRLVEEEGLLIGPSSGAALAAGLQLAATLASASREQAATIVMIFPDSGARYVTEGLFALPDALPLRL